MFGPVLVGRDERQIDLTLTGAGQLDLGFFGCVLEALQREAVLPQLDAGISPELIRQIINDALVKILAAEERVAIRRLDLKHTIAKFEHGNIEGAAAEIIDSDFACALLLQSIGQRRRGWLV